MTSVSKNVYIDKVNDIVSEYNNTYHRTIKMKSADIKDSTYIDFKKEVIDKVKYKTKLLKLYKQKFSEIYSIISAN